jgi:4-carboxymuconolactone decarboxylase
MALLDPAQRTQRGIDRQTELTGKAAPEPATLYEASWRDFIFAEVWTRPGLDRRSRLLISIAGAGNGDAPSHILDNYIRGALTLKELTLAELREAALHHSVYSGWMKGGIVDAAITRVANELGLPPAATPPIRAEPWDPAERTAFGQAGFLKTMTFPGGPPSTPYTDGGIFNFVFGEMWMRPGLDERSRRWITLVGVSNSSSEIPIKSHIFSAMKSGNASVDEMYEFVLQYALHAGWPKGSVINGVVGAMADRISKGLSFQ